MDKKKIFFGLCIFFVAITIVFLFFPYKKAIAETDFDKLTEAAKLCVDSNGKDEKCLQTFNDMQNSHSDLNAQKTAQEKFGIVGGYGNHGFDPTNYLTAWNFNNLPEEERKKYYKETELENGRILREYWIYAEDKEIEIAPGVFFPAWTYNGQVPAPTIRATEGDLIRIYFQNRGTKPHTMHFHGVHNSSMDGAMTEDFVYPGQSFTYEFDADPFGVHLFHCQTTQTDVWPKPLWQSSGEQWRLICHLGNSRQPRIVCGAEKFSILLEP